MQSIIQEKSYNSAKVFWLDKIALETNLRECVQLLVARQKEVEKIILFGSVAENRETVHSDVDLLIMVSMTKERFIDRPLQYKNYFADLGLGTDIFVYTESEFARSPFYNKINSKGMILYSRH